MKRLFQVLYGITASFMVFISGLLAIVSIGSYSLQGFSIAVVLGFHAGYSYYLLDQQL